MLARVSFEVISPSSTSDSVLRYSDADDAERLDWANGATQTDGLIELECEVASMPPRS